MQKTLLALLMLIGSFTSSHLMSAETSTLSAKQLLAKDHDFRTVTSRGKLLFTFATTTAAIGPTPTPAGETDVNAANGIISTPRLFQVSIVTPNKKVIKGPKINVNNELSEFTIIVDPPILFGTYTIVVKNISITSSNGNFSNSNTLIEPIVVVQNSLNTNRLFVEVEGFATDPGDSYQGEFVPTSLFFHNKD
jgi:hypothetical protein